MFTCVLGRLVASTVLSVRNLSESADRVGGHLRGDKECPCSGVTKSGRVWRKVPESDARIVTRGGPLFLRPRYSDERSPIPKSTIPIQCAGYVKHVRCLLFQIALPDDSAVFKEGS